MMLGYERGGESLYSDAKDKILLFTCTVSKGLCRVVGGKLFFFYYHYLIQQQIWCRFFFSPPYFRFLKRRFSFRNYTHTHTDTRSECLLSIWSKSKSCLLSGHSVVAPFFFDELCTATDERTIIMYISFKLTGRLR